MSVSTKLAAAMVGGVLFATTYAPAWAQFETRSPNVSPGEDGTKIVRPRVV